MGDKLVEIFDIVEKKAGLPGRIKLVEKLKIPRDKASELNDSKELIKDVMDAASEILGEDISKHLS